MACRTSNAAANDHRWEERAEPHLKLESGEVVAQHYCSRCDRDIVTILSSGKRHAAFASILCFYRLDDEVTARWLNEPCPGRRTLNDDADRKTAESRQAAPQAKRRLISKAD